MNVTQPQLMKALFAWLTANLPAEFKVAWADYRRQDRTTKPFLLLSQLTGPSMDGWDESVYQDNKRILKGQRITVISFLFYPDEKKTYDNIESVRQVQERLTDQMNNRVLYEQGIVIDTVGNLQNLTDSDDVKYGFDLTLRSAAYREDTFQEVAAIEATIEVDSLQYIDKITTTIEVE